MKTFIFNMTVNSLAKDVDRGNDKHSAGMFGAEAHGTMHNLTLDGMSDNMAKVLGGAYAKQRGVRLLIEVCEPGEEPHK